jgi:hypothetical protein
MRLSGPCNIDTDTKGSEAKWFTDSGCTKPAETLSDGSYYGGYGYCSRAVVPFPSPSPAVSWDYQVTCAATPCCSTSGIIVSFAILIAFGAC